MVEALNTIQDEEDLVERYDQEITRLRLLTEKLENEKAKVMEHIGKLRSSLLTIRRLPVEILSHIFTLVCAAQSEDSYSKAPRGVLGGSLRITDGKQPEVTTLHLSQVCWRWREIVVGLPNLWASISVYIDEHYHYNALDSLLRYLERSKGSPLDLYIRGAIGYDPEEVAADPDVMQTLTREFSRCKTLGIYEFLPFLSADWGVEDMQFPLLETLRLDTDMMNEEDDPVDMDNSFWHGIRDNTPRLLHCQTSLSPLVLPFLPWAQLTSIHLILYREGLDNVRPLQHLSAALQLHSLTVDFRRDWADPIFFDIHIELKSLRRLNAYSEYATDVASLLDIFTFPSLRHLSVSADSMEVEIAEEEVALGPALINMVKRSSCTISDISLEVDVTVLMSLSLSDICSACPSVTRLGMTVKNIHRCESEIIPKFLSSLMVASSDPQSGSGFDSKNETSQPLLPNLRSFDLAVTICKVSVAGPVIDNFLGIAESRRRITETGGVSRIATRSDRATFPTGGRRT
ncbi:hypothetical protein PM082_003243 [Marasmius tenuissimus]|nr:hypothetical protein PM082_003243 [Marasmius tenuissimus]